jgi:transcriptional regulator with XRE-family HTH domain
MPTKKPKPTDVLVGQRVRMARLMSNMSQTELGEHIGITFQQVQKYENGTNRVSATMLMKLSDALALSVTDLLQEVDPSAVPLDAEGQAAQLVAAYAKIQSSEVRAAVLTLVAGLALR